jgi:hypothetical protein
VIGLTSGFIGAKGYFHAYEHFVLHWFATAAVSILISFFLVRRQALQAKEAFWTPPTRRVSQAFAPPLFAGLMFGIVSQKIAGDFMAWILPAVWMILYGCALHSAGFFMVRGIKWLGWLFIAAGCGVFIWRALTQNEWSWRDSHCAMASCFGGLHLAYGVYLYFTERRKNAA